VLQHCCKRTDLAGIFMAEQFHDRTGSGHAHQKVNGSGLNIWGII
jgi:hypothetical protein